LRRVKEEIAVIRAIEDSINVKLTALKDQHFLDNAAKSLQIVKNSLDSGHTIFLAGNGGSAAESQHFAAEFVGRFKKERRGLPALALSTDTSILTAVGNDYSYDEIFERQVDTFGKKGDVFIGFSTSGNSENILRAVKKSKEKEMTTICFLGKDGGKARDIADISVVIPSDNTARIQEMHMTMTHIIAGWAEQDY